MNETINITIEDINPQTTTATINETTESVDVSIVENSEAVNVSVSEIGAVGPKGDTGPQGATGPQGPQGPQGPTISSSKFFGFIDYNDTTGSIPLSAETWTDVPNNGQGQFSNTDYKPDDVEGVLNVSTGYLDFSDLTLGSELLIRHDLSVNPNTNNALLQMRYVLGQGVGEYPLLFWSERLDAGSGIDYQRVPLFALYMGDTNTKDGVGKLQIKLSTTGTFTNAGSYISVKLR